MISQDGKAMVRELLKMSLVSCASETCGLSQRFRSLGSSDTMQTCLGTGQN